MAKLSKNFEKGVKSSEGGLHLHELRIETNIDVPSREDAGSLEPQDFDLNLFIDGKFIADIGHILSEANPEAYNDIIYSTDWELEYCEDKASDKEFYEINND